MNKTYTFTPKEVEVIKDCLHMEKTRTDEYIEDAIGRGYKPSEEDISFVRDIEDIEKKLK